jgi:hypothetical protein
MTTVLLVFYQVLGYLDPMVIVGEKETKLPKDGKIA